MKESDITPKIIELAKEIAEHCRMEIYVGCWYVENGKICAELMKRGDGFFKDGMKIKVFEKAVDITPIPSISDCLEKFRELGISVALQDHILLTYAVGIMDESNEYKPCANSESPLEALLSALLEELKK